MGNDVMRRTLEKYCKHHVLNSAISIVGARSSKFMKTSFGKYRCPNININPNAQSPTTYMSFTLSTPVVSNPASLAMYA